MDRLNQIKKTLKQHWDNLPVYLFFGLPFLMYYLIMRFRVVNDTNGPCVLAASSIFIMMLCYSIYKYLQLEYYKQTHNKPKKKKNNIKREK